jgi:hypothetical protein
MSSPKRQVARAAQLAGGITLALAASLWQATAYAQGPALVGPAQAYVPVAQPVYYSSTVQALYPPVTIWNWWRPRPVVGYYGTTAVAVPTAAAPVTAYYAPTVAAAPVVSAPAVMNPPVSAYYSPPAAVAPTTAYYPPATTNAPVSVYYPSTAVAAPVVAAPAVAGPTVVYRPIVTPPQAYLYSRGPLGFPRLDPVPTAPLVPVVIP